MIALFRIISIALQSFSLFVKQRPSTSDTPFHVFEEGIRRGCIIQPRELKMEIMETRSVLFNRADITGEPIIFRYFIILDRNCRRLAPVAITKLYAPRRIKTQFARRINFYKVTKRE